MRCLITAMRGVASGRGRTYDDIDAARRWLASHDGHTGRTGVIGFCLGGCYALAVATGAYDASSVNYGFIDDPRQALEGACPIVGSYGAKDRSLTDVPQQLDQVLTELSVAHDIKVYDDAGHGFLNDHPPNEKPLWACFVGSFVNDGYHEPSATDARRRIIDFFDTHLKR
jgi:carboxymethylenebutenolidase